MLSILSCAIYHIEILLGEVSDQIFESLIYCFLLLSVGSCSCILDTSLSGIYECCLKVSGSPLHCFNSIPLCQLCFKEKKKQYFPSKIRSYITVDQFCKLFICSFMCHAFSVNLICFFFSICLRWKLRSLI